MPVFTVFPKTWETFDAFPTWTKFAWRLVPSGMKTFPAWEADWRLTAPMPVMVASLRTWRLAEKNAGALQDRAASDVLVLDVVVDVEDDEVEVLDVLEVEVGGLLVDEDVVTTKSRWRTRCWRTSRTTAGRRRGRRGGGRRRRGWTTSIDVLAVVWSTSWCSTMRCSTTCCSTS
jgi:hypothetical protein